MSEHHIPEHWKHCLAFLIIGTIVFSAFSFILQHQHRQQNGLWVGGRLIAIHESTVTLEAPYRGRFTVPIHDTVTVYDHGTATSLSSVIGQYITIETTETESEFLPATLIYTFNPPHRD